MKKGVNARIIPKSHLSHGIDNHVRCQSASPSTVLLEVLYWLQFCDAVVYVKLKFNYHTINKTNAHMASIALTSLFILFISERKKFHFNN
jgi:hypothetical protein